MDPVTSRIALHFFPKKLIILPCPGFPPDFFPFPSDDNGVDTAVFCFCGGGSSSEKDSQAGSSLVTERRSCYHQLRMYVSRGR